MPGRSPPELFAIELRTGRFEAMVAWYREALGLRVLLRVVDDGYALLSAGGTRIAILSRPDPGLASGRVSLAFEVVDLAVATARLEAVGANVTRPSRSHEGFREIVTHDPDGNRLRLFAWGEGVN